MPLPIFMFKLDFKEIDSQIFPLDLGSFSSDLSYLNIVDPILAEKVQTFQKQQPRVKVAIPLIINILHAIKSELYQRIVVSLRFHPPHITWELDALIAIDFIKKHYPEEGKKVVCYSNLETEKLLKEDGSQTLVIEYSGANHEAAVPIMKHYPLLLRNRIQNNPNAPYILSGSLAETLAVTNKYWYRMLAEESPIIWKGETPFLWENSAEAMIAKPIFGTACDGIIVGDEDDIYESANEDTVYVIEPFISSERQNRRCLGLASFTLYFDKHDELHIEIGQASWLLSPLEDKLMNIDNATEVLPLSADELENLKQELITLMRPLITNLINLDNADLEQLYEIDENHERLELIKADYAAHPLYETYSLPRNQQLTIPYNPDLSFFRKRFAVDGLHTLLIQHVKTMPNSDDERRTASGIDTIRSSNKYILHKELTNFYLKWFEKQLKATCLFKIAVSESELSVTCARYCLEELTLILKDQVNDEYRLALMVNCLMCYFILNDLKSFKECSDKITEEDPTRVVTNKTHHLYARYTFLQLAKAAAEPRNVLNSDGMGFETKSILKLG